MSQGRQFTISYTVTKSPIDPARVGGTDTLVCEARAMNPPVDKHTRSDTRYAGNFESTILDQWEEISVRVIRIEHGVRDDIVATNLSKHLDFKQFFQSAANGQQMLLDATDIGGVDTTYSVKLISTSNELSRVKTKQLFNTSFKLQIVTNN